MKSNERKQAFAIWLIFTVILIMNVIAIINYIYLKDIFNKEIAKVLISLLFGTCLSIVIHELGHIITAAIVGIKVKTIRIRMLFIMPIFSIECAEKQVKKRMEWILFYFGGAFFTELSAVIIEVFLLSSGSILIKFLCIILTLNGFLNILPIWKNDGRAILSIMKYHN